MIIKPDKTEEEFKYADKFRVEYIDVVENCKINAKVKVTYVGGINESYSAQIGATKIEIITD